jgi:hypothetical protein
MKCRAVILYLELRPRKDKGGHARRVVPVILQPTPRGCRKAIAGISQSRATVGPRPVSYVRECAGL